MSDGEAEVKETNAQNLDTKEGLISIVPSESKEDITAIE